MSQYLTELEQGYYKDLALMLVSDRSYLQALLREDVLPLEQNQKDFWKCVSEFPFTKNKELFAEHVRNYDVGNNQKLQETKNILLYCVRNYMDHKPEKNTSRKSNVRMRVKLSPR